MKKFLFRLTLGAGLLVAAALLYIGVPVLRAGAGLPVWDGSTTVAGLDHEVTITRSEYGTPFTEAETQADLYFAQGFVHAQDRFWQMAMGRRLALGRLAEWLGAPALAADRYSRMWMWRDLAVRSYEALAAEERALLDAYAAGVNAWLEGPLYRRPPEMRVLHVHPEPWKGSDALLIMFNVHAMLRGNGSEQLRYEISPERVPDVERAVEILNTSGPDAPTILSASSEAPGTHSASAMTDGNFSNSWLLSGAHTVSGLPLVANDPHLAIGLPGVWQIQHLTLNGRRMAGGTIPGFPSIVVGHNGAVAWAVTNSTVNTMDATLLELEMPDGRRYRSSPGGPWQEFGVREEVFGVRFGSDVTELQRTTEHGAVWLEDLDPPLLEGRPGFTIEIVDVAMEALNRGPVALMGMLHIDTVEEGMELMGEMTLPSVNVSFADTAGSIGCALSGRIPIRSRESAEQIAFAAWDTSERTHLDPAESPRLLNPESGRIVTANQRIATEEEFPTYLSDSFASGYRASRIHEALDERPRHDVESFRAMQQDGLTPEARELTPWMLEAKAATPADQALVDLLAEWDFRFTPESAAPLVWSIWMRQLGRELLDEAGPTRPFRESMLTPAIVLTLSGEWSELCNRVETPEVETCADALTKTLTQTREILEAGWGPGVDDWQWERVQFKLGHLGFADLPLLGQRFSRSTSIPAGLSSLFNNNFIIGDTPDAFPLMGGAGYQGIYDLSDLDASLFMAPGGPSGHVGSDYYNNLTPLWIAGERMRLDPDEIGPIATLTLAPGGE